MGNGKRKWKRVTDKLLGLDGIGALGQVRINLYILHALGGVSLPTLYSCLLVVCSSLGARIMYGARWEDLDHFRLFDD